MKSKKSSKAGLDEFISQVSSGDIKPVYIFTGDQSHLIDKALHEIRAKVLGAEDDINYVIFHGDTVSGDEVLESASTVPMFSSGKIVVVKNAEKLKAKELEAIEPYLDSPSPSSTLILIFSDGKAPKIKRKKGLARFDFSIQKGNTTSAVIEEAQSLGLKISPRAAQTLISLVGEDLQELNNELIKLSLYRKGGAIEIEDIEEHIRKTQYGDVFALINAISKKSRKEAQKALMDLEAQGEEPLSVLSRLIWRFRLIWKAKELSDQKVPKAEILKELKISQGAFYYLSQDTVKYSYKDISRIMGLLLECDKKLKMSYVPRNYHLTNLVAQLCSSG